MALFEPSCAAGDSSACGNLGLMVDDGRAGRKDRQRALELFDKACDLGEAESCFSLGRAYQTGNGRERDIARAIALLERTLALDPETSSAGEAKKALALARAPAKDLETTPASR